MKRKLLALTLVAAMSVTMIGCGQKAPAENKDVSKEPVATEQPAAEGDWTKEEITLNVIHSHTEEAQKTIISSTAFGVALEKFKQDYPNVTIEETMIPDSDYQATLLQYAASDDLPDLFWWEPGKKGTYVDGGLVHDLTGYVDPSLYMDGLASTTYDGRVYGVSMKVSDNNIVYYDQTLLKEVAGLDEFPTKLEDFLALSETFKAKGMDLISFGNKGQWFASHQFATAVIYEVCGDEWTSEFLQGKADLTNPKFREACEWLRKIGSVLNPDFNARDDGWAIGWYAQGKAFSHVSGSWSPNTFLGYKGEFPEKIDNTRAAIFPSISGDKAIISSGMSHTWSINSKIEKDSSKFKAALELLNYICGRPFADYMTENGSISPMVANSEVDMSGFEPIVKSFMEVHNGGYVAKSPVSINLVTDVNTVFVADLQTLMDGSITVDQFIADIQAAQDSIIQ